MILTNASLLFLQIIFYKNCIFTKKYFLHFYAYWEFFLDYIDLLYHFGMLKMSTLCTFQCFFTKAHQISVIQTNVSVLFFQTGLISLVKTEIKHSLLSEIHFQCRKLVINSKDKYYFGTCQKF